MQKGLVYESETEDTQYVKKKSSTASLESSCSSPRRDQGVSLCIDSEVGNSITCLESSVLLGESPELFSTPSQRVNMDELFGI